jgi:ATP-dependent helicase HrpA
LLKLHASGLRYAASIDPAWAESLAGSLTRTTYAEPHWSASQGAAVAKAKVLLYGLPIVEDRNVQWGSINPVEARDMLIRQGLVEGDIQQRFSYDGFVDANRTILEQADEDASRTRRIVDSVSDEDLVDFYDKLIPNDVTSLAALAAWWKSEHQQHPHMLDFDPEEVDRLRENTTISLDDYPDQWHTVGSDGAPINLKLSYIYDPHADNDGVTVHIPLKYLSRLSEEEFTWTVPGLLDDLIVGTIKSLPQNSASAVRTSTRHGEGHKNLD